MHRAARTIVAALAVAGLVAGIVATQGGGTAGAAAPYYSAGGREGSVYRLYRAYFLREPDQSGFSYWYLQSAKGQPLASISETFARSSEFRRRYGSLDDRKFVDLVYRNVLGRPADANGSDYWTRKLAAGTSRGQVMANFSQASEYVRKMEDDAWVISLYASMVRTAPPADELSFFRAGLTSSQTSLTEIAGWLYDSDAYRARFA